MISGADGSPLELAAPLDTSAAEPAVPGANYSELYDLLPASPGSPLRIPLAFGPDSALVMSEMAPPGDAGLISQAIVGLFDGSSFHPLPPADVSSLPGEPRQAVAADVDGRRVAWLETPSTDLFFSNWRIFLSDGPSTQLVGRSEQVLDDLMPIVHGDGYPTLGAGAVFWETPYPRGEKDAAGHYQDFGVEIVGAPFAGGELVEVARDRFAPAAYGDGVIFVRQAPWDGESAQVSDYRIEYGGTGLPVQTLITALLPGKDRRVIALDATDDTIVWAVASGDGNATLYIYDVAGKRVQPIELHDESLSLSVADDLVGWGNGSGNRDAGEYVYELTSGRLWTLGTQQGLSEVLVAEASVAWSHVDPATGIGGRTVAAWLSR